MEYNWHRRLHYSWHTLLDRLPEPEFKKRLAVAILDDGIIPSLHGPYKIKLSRIDPEWLEKRSILAEAEIIKDGEAFCSGQISWHMMPCSQCGQEHARQLQIGGEMKCSDCVANNVRAASRKSSAAYRERNRKPKEPIACAHCGQEFTPKRSTAQFCSVKCRVSANRANA